jgi:hypothetical protein
MSRSSIRTRITAIAAALLTVISVSTVSSANASALVSAPNNVTATTSGANSLTIAWTAPAATVVSGYNIEYSTSDVFNADGSLAGGTIISLGAPVTAAAITNLESNRLYYIHVATVTATGKSVYSALTSGYTGSVPSAPTAPTVASYFAGGALIGWTAPAAGNTAVTGYRVEWSADNTFKTGVQADVVGASLTSYAIFGLKAGAKYYARIASLNVAVTSPWTGTLTVTAQGAPAGPVTPTVKATGGHAVPSLTVSLISAPAANGVAIDFYRVDYSTTSTFTAATTKATYMDPTSRTKVLTGLKNGTLYYVRVFAHNRLGYSKVSPVTMQKTIK